MNSPANSGTPSRPRDMDCEPSDRKVEEQASGSNDNVRVAVRVRPLNTREKSATSDERFSWVVTPQAITQSVSGKKIASNNYVFDNVFQPPADNRQIFETVAKPVVSSAVEGINGVIFAYGQTAAGKTHTMLGNESDLGVTPRSIQAVFDAIGKYPNRTFLLRATYIEIYNEVIRDLLFPANDNLKIHEDSINKRVYVDAKEEIVSSVENVMAIIAAGEHVRAVGETNMNDRSSRSHTIFTLKIDSREMTAADARQRRQTIALQNGEPIPDEDSDDDDDSANEGVAVRASSMSLVDLAGSERASFTKAQGMRLVEGGHINKSLLTLGNVINKLSSGELNSKSLAHIPYRDSKLTRLLQPALGGNARTAIICAVTPAVLHMDETISTLKFASRAKKVTNSAKTNEFLDDRAKLRRAERLIADLKNRLDVIEKNGVIQTPNRSSHSGGSERSPGARRRISSATRAQLEKQGERRFERLLDTIAKHESKRRNSSNTSHSPGSMFFSPRKKRRVTSSLHLMYGPSARRLSNAEPSKSKHRETSMFVSENEDTSAAVEAQMAELRKRAFSAEKEKRILMSEVRYEREASQREVAHLIAAGEEANSQRNLALQECNEMHLELSREMGRSFVDEIFSNAVNLSELKRELRTAGSRLSHMQTVQTENKDQKQKLVDLTKKLAEFSRREKRGIGPVLKDCKAAQKKQAELEAKLRTVKQQASQATADKTRLEREIKGKDRQVKMLTNRVDQQTRKEETRFESRLNQELGKVQKKADAKEEQLVSTIQRLQEDLKSTSAELKRVNTELVCASQKSAEVEGNLERQVGELKSANAELVCASQKSAEVEAHLQSQVRDLKSANAELVCASRKSAEVEAHLQSQVCDLESANVELVCASQKAAEVEAHLQSQVRDLESANAELVCASQKSAEAEAHLQSQVRDLESANAELVCASRKSAEVEAHLQSQVRDLESANAELVCASRKSAEAEAHLQSQVRDLESANAELLCASRTACEVEERLQNEVIELKSGNDKLVYASRKSAEVEAHLQSQVRDLESANAELLCASQKAGDVDARLQNEVRDLKSANDELLVASRTACEVEERLQNEVRELKSANDKLVYASRMACEVEERLQSQVRELKSANSEMVSTLEQLSGELQKAEKALSSEKGHCIHWTVQLKKAMETVQVKQREVDELDLKLSKLTAIGGEHSEMKKRLLWRDSKIASLEKHNDRLRNSLTMKHPHVLDRDIRRLQETEVHNHRLQTEKDALVKKVQKLEGVHDQLKRDIFSLRERIKNEDINRIQKSIEYKKGLLLEQNRQ